MFPIHNARWQLGATSQKKCIFLEWQYTPSRANNIECLPSVWAQGSYKLRRTACEVEVILARRWIVWDLIRELVLDIEVNRTDLCVKCVCSLPPPREPNIQERQSTAPILNIMYWSICFPQVAERTWINSIYIQKVSKCWHLICNLLLRFLKTNMAVWKIIWL